jgi:multidrug efflux system membrane fusion protein
VLGFVALAIAGLVLLRRSANGAATTASGRPGMALAAVPVTVTAATQGDIAVYLDALGTVTPLATVNVTSRVDGEVLRVNYREGQLVQKGDALVEIDPQLYQAQLKQVEGQYERDKAQLDGARLDLERYRNAYSRNAVAKQTMDDQEQTMRQYQGTVKNDEGQLESARTQLSYCHIQSPIAGRVGLRQVDPGNVVHAAGGTTLVVVTQLDPITVVFSIAEDHLEQVQRQLRKSRTLPVDIFDRGQQKKIASGTLLTIDNQVDTTTGTVKFKALFANGDGALFPNQFVNARLVVDTLHNVTLIPTVAIQHNAQNAFIYRLQPNQTVSTAPVTVLAAEGVTSAVTGVHPGDQVAVSGFDTLQDGAKVALAGQPQAPGGSRP